MLEWLLQYWLDVALKGHTSQNCFYFNGLAIVYFTLGLLFADCTLFFRRARNVCEKGILISSCLSVHPHGTTLLPLDRFSCFIVDSAEICQPHLFSF